MDFVLQNTKQDRGNGVECCTFFLCPDQPGAGGDPGEGRHAPGRIHPEKALADVAAAIDKATKAVVAREEQAIKALTGVSRLDLGIINQLMPKQKATLEAAREEYQWVLMVNQAEEETLAEKRALRAWWVNGTTYSPPRLFRRSA